MEALDHPVNAALGRRLRVVTMPSRLWDCAGPASVDAIKLMIEGASGPTAAAL
jgi:iron complex transport system substrate-binding protein